MGHMETNGGQSYRGREALTEVSRRVITVMPRWEWVRTRLRSSSIIFALSKPMMRQTLPRWTPQDPIVLQPLEYLG
jgi:hypothetical protein